MEENPQVMEAWQHLTYMAGKEDGRKGEERFVFIYPEQQEVYDAGYADGRDMRRATSFVRRVFRCIIGNEG